MHYKPFSENFWQTIESTILQLKQENSANLAQLVAAFDADGTLWDTDLGENFFQYQIDNHLVELPPDAFNYYLELKKKNNDPREAYMWLAQINRNQPLELIQKWAKEAFESIQPRPIFSEQQKLINLFLKHNIQVYIVTASVKWAVEPGALALGLKHENVIGIETEINSQGLITDKPCYPITYRQGKVDALLNKTQQKLPFFSSGNTMGDFELLKSATHLRLAVSAASRDDKLFKTENELAEIANNENWFSHRFI